MLYSSGRVRPVLNMVNYYAGQLDLIHKTETSANIFMILRASAIWFCLKFP